MLGPLQDTLFGSEVMASTEQAKDAPRQRLKWSLKTAFWVFLSIGLLSTAGVLSLSHKDLWIELEMVVALVALLLFIFYFWVLYHGVNFHDDGQLGLKFSSFDVSDPWPYEGLGLIHLAEDPVSLILFLLVEFVLLMVFAFVFSFLIWLGMNGVVLAITLLTIPLFYIFRSSVRFVLRNSPACCGDFLKSVCVAAGFAVFKSCWFFAIVAGAHYLAMWYRGE